MIGARLRQVLFAETGTGFRDGRRGARWRSSCMAAVPRSCRRSQGERPRVSTPRAVMNRTHVLRDGPRNTERAHRRAEDRRGVAAAEPGRRVERCQRRRRPRARAGGHERAPWTRLARFATGLVRNASPSWSRRAKERAPRARRSRAAARAPGLQHAVAHEPARAPRHLVSLRAARRLRAPTSGRTRRWGRRSRESARRARGLSYSLTKGRAALPTECDHCPRALHRGGPRGRRETNRLCDLGVLCGERL